MNLSHGLFCYFTIEILYYFMIFRLDKKKQSFLTKFYTLTLFTGLH